MNWENYVRLDGGLVHKLNIIKISRVDGVMLVTVTNYKYLL